MDISKAKAQKPELEWFKITDSDFGTYRVRILKPKPSRVQELIQDASNPVFGKAKSETEIDAELLSDLLLEEVIREWDVTDGVDEAGKPKLAPCNTEKKRELIDNSYSFANFWRLLMADLVASPSVEREGQQKN